MAVIYGGLLKNNSFLKSMVWIINKEQQCVQPRADTESLSGTVPHYLLENRFTVMSFSYATTKVLLSLAYGIDSHTRCQHERVPLGAKGEINRCPIAQGGCLTSHAV